MRSHWSHLKPGATPKKGHRKGLFEPTLEFEGKSPVRYLVTPRLGPPVPLAPVLIWAQPHARLARIAAWSKPRSPRMQPASRVVHNLPPSRPRDSKTSPKRTSTGVTLSKMVKQASGGDSTSWFLGCPEQRLHIGNLLSLTCSALSKQAFASVTLPLSRTVRIRTSNSDALVKLAAHLQKLSFPKSGKAGTPFGALMCAHTWM